MLGLFSSVRLLGMAAIAVSLWFAYGWGSQIISNYSRMQAEITTLRRDKALIETRVTSLRTLLARRDAAIAASSCKAQIEHWIKNPDQIPTKFDPFNQLK